MLIKLKSYKSCNPDVSEDYEIPGRLRTNRKRSFDDMVTFSSDEATVAREVKAKAERNPKYSK